MSIFGNETEMMGARIMPPVATAGDDGYAAFGKPVPESRRNAGYQACKAMGLTDREAIFTLIGRMSTAIERDEPHEAMRLAKAHLDVTGVYRLLATLCTEPSQ